MPDESLPQRSLKTTVALAALFMCIFALRGQLTVTFGLAIGAGLGLFSLWTLAFFVPGLTASGNPAARFWLMLLTLAKLPIYMLALSFAMTSHYVNPLAVFVGVALVPLVVVLKVVGYQQFVLTQSPTGDDACPSKATLSN